MSIKNIVFDLGGVILNISYQAAIEAFKELGVRNFDDLFTQAGQVHLFDRFDKGEISPAMFRGELRRLSGMPLTDEAIDNAWNAMLLDLPWPRIDLLEGIKGNYRLFLLSNTNAIHFPVFRDYLQRTFGFDNMDQLFEKQYLSYIIGMRKPDRAPFDLIVSENDLIPEETLFVDDSEQHMEGAIAAGMRAFWLNNKELQVTDLFNFRYQLRPEVLAACR